MIEAPAEVVRVERDRAWVRVTERQGGCGRCDEPGGCRSMRITEAFGPSNSVFAVQDTLGVQQGDRVRLCIPEHAPLRAAMMSYGLGVVLMLLGAALGNQLAGTGNADVHAAVGAAGGLLLAYVLNRTLARSRRWRGMLTVSMVRETGECLSTRS